VIIDWGNAALGDPVADLARSELLITISWRLLPRRRDRYLARFIVALFSRWHMSHYLKVTGLDSSNLARWRTVIGAARLNEDIPAEREPLTKLVRAGLAQA
jgi:aminoglycoside phosphotransferase (APT) family kinase protein